MKKHLIFKYFKTSPEIIKLTVMYYVRYPLSLRQIEDILHERGIDICHETVRFWWNRFGSKLAKSIKKKPAYRPSNWRWHIDEVFVKINGEQYYLWRAVDQEGSVLDAYVSKKRDKKTARKILTKLIKKYGKPRQIVTDKLASYKAALRDMKLIKRQVTGRYKNNQIENPHLHFRRREKMMSRFRSIKTLQKFTAIQGAFQNLFNHQRHIEKRENFKNLRQMSEHHWQGLFAA
jgi:putative transposase